MFFGTKSTKTGEIYYLHSKKVDLKGKEHRIYYFKREIDKEFALKEIPLGFELTSNSRTGLPLLKKIAKKE